MSLFCSQENDKDLKYCEIQQDNATVGWNSESTTFDLANYFTHNPRLMSPSNFRTPPKAPLFSGEPIFFDGETNSGAFDRPYTDVCTSTPISQSPAATSSPVDPYLSPKGRITSPSSQAMSHDDQNLSLHSLTPNADRTFRVEDHRFSSQDHSVSPEQFFSPEDQSVSGDNHQTFSPEGLAHSPLDGHYFSVRGNSISPQGQTASPGDSPSLQQKHSVSPEGLISSFTGQSSTPEGQISTPTQQEDHESTQPGDESGISLFSETRFHTSGENSGAEEERQSISDFSDGSSSKLNWSLSASLSSSAVSVSHSDSGRSLGDTSDDSLSSAACARRRHRRRDRSRLSASTASQDGTRVINSSAYFGDYGRDDKRALASQGSQEVSNILTGAPVAMVTPRDQAAVRQSPIRGYDGYHRRRRGEVMNWDEFESPGKVYPRPPVKRKHLTPFYPHGNPSCNDSHCLQSRRKWGFKNPQRSSKITVGRQLTSEAPTASYDSAWPSLPRRVSPQKTTSLLNDLNKLAIRKAVQSPSTHGPHKVDTANIELRRSVDSMRTSQYKSVSLSSLIDHTCQQHGAQPNTSSTRQQAKSDTTMQDPAVLHAFYSQAGALNSTLRQFLGNRFPSQPRRDEYRCGAMTIADDPAILAVGTPVYSTYAGVQTHKTDFEYCYYFG